MPRLNPDQRGIKGPFDIIGDVHGCAGELYELLGKLGYSVGSQGEGANRRIIAAPPHGRRAIFVGDLVDRGPRSPEVLHLVMSMVEAGHALAVPGDQG